MTHYLIEFRFFGKTKHELKDLIWGIDRKFRLGHARRRRPVPHITLVGPFYTRDEERLISDFEELCAKQPIMTFRVRGFGTFNDTRVVYLNIEPSETLDEFRWELSNKLRDYCNLTSFDLERKFHFHATIAMKLSRHKFNEIKKYIEAKPGPEFTCCVMRVTLIKNQKILREYDFFLRRLLSRGEAKSRSILSESFKRLENFMQERVNEAEGITAKEGKLIVGKKPPRQNICFYCDKIIRELPYQCNYCGEYFCPTHHLPEAHECPELERSWDTYRRELEKRWRPMEPVKVPTWGKELGWKYVPARYPARKAKRPSKMLGAVAKIMGGAVVSFFSLVLLIFGILLVGTKIGWFSIPWIEGWGTLFIWFIPVEFFIVLAGIGAIVGVLGITGRKGCISMLIAGVAICLIVVTTFPNATKILFWRGEEGEFMEAYVRSDSYLPFVSEGYVVGGDGHKIWLHNNPGAKNPSFDELLMFLEQDKTEQKPYLPGLFVCADFAEILHNNAERAGIRCAYVLVEFSDTPGGHALNAFKTVDKGLVFVDVTSSLYGTGNDCIVVIEIGRPYMLIPLFSDVIYEPIGTVKSYRIQW